MDPIKQIHMQMQQHEKNYNHGFRHIPDISSQNSQQAVNQAKIEQQKIHDYQIKDKLIQIEQNYEIAYKQSIEMDHKEQQKRQLKLKSQMQKQASE